MFTHHFKLKIWIISTRKWRTKILKTLSENRFAQNKTEFKMGVVND